MISFFNRNVKYNEIKGSAGKYFSENYYRSTLGKNSHLVIDSFRHYCRVGWKKGLNPSEHFDTEFYLKRHKDVAASGMCPLVHYVQHGRAEGRFASPIEELVSRVRAGLFDRYFDDRFYAGNSGGAVSLENAAEHYFSIGWTLGWNPSPDFDTKYYLERYPDVREALINPLLHYVKNGEAELRFKSRGEELWALEQKSLISEYFDIQYYIEDSSKLDHSNDVVLHYILRGWKEGRKPNEIFDTNEYLLHNPQLRAGEVNPFAHYLANCDERERSKLAEIIKKTSPYYPGEVLTVTIGEIVSVNGRLVSGWLLSDEPSAREIAISVYDATTLIDRFKVSGHTSDLPSAEKRRHFSWRAPSSLANGQRHKLTFKCQGSILAPADQFVSGFIFEQDFEAAGHVDSITDRAIVGWACNLKRPADSIDVLVEIDGIVCGSVRADAPRIDLVNLGIGQGNHGFTYVVPQKYKDGAKHNVVCLVDGGPLELPKEHLGSVVFQVSASTVIKGVPPRNFEYIAPGNHGTPDLFLLRSRSDSARSIIIAELASYSDWLDFDQQMSVCTLDSYDVVVICAHHGAIASLKSNFSRCSNFYVLGYSPKTEDCVRFLHVINSALAADNARAFLLFSRTTTDADLTSTPELYSEVSPFGVLSVSTSMRDPGGDGRTKALLSTVLPRIGSSYISGQIRVASGRLHSIDPLLLRQAAALTLSAKDLLGRDGKEREDWRTKFLALLSYMAHEGELIVAGLREQHGITTNGFAANSDHTIKTIAFFLPQFHPIEENSRWWGAGFTEWSNVVRARPQFRNHHQPRVPKDLGYYDLRLPQTQKLQAKLAREHGVHGFCYYYYWFDGKKILNQPIEQMLQDPEIALPFCVCWANENWSRNWDGQEKFVLLQQSYSQESNLSLIHEFIAMMRDRRYIRHQGKPVLLVYRIRVIPEWKEVAKLWREECRKAGIGEIHLCAVRFGLEPLDGAPEDFGLDAYVMFPPHETVRQDIRSTLKDLKSDFNGEVLSYDAVVAGDLARFEQGYPWPVHRGAMMGWDNTARRMQDARIFHGCTPMKFRRWLKNIVRQELAHGGESESLLFINAWNEWAEGTVLEPDQRFGDSYLRVVRATAGEYAPPLISSTNQALSVEPTKRTAAFFSPTTQITATNKLQLIEGDFEGRPEQPNVLLCAHVSGHYLFGGERSFLDVATALSVSGYNVIVTLPSGNNREYVTQLRKVASKIYILPYQQWYGQRDVDQHILLNFSEIIIQNNIQVVYANTIVLLEPLEAARRLNRTRVIHVRELISLDAPLQDRLGLGAEDVIKTVFERSDYVIANSEATRRLFSRQDRTFYVPNAVDSTQFSQSNEIQGKIKFGIVSSNIPKKGISDFIAVAKHCQELSDIAEFVVIGPENQHLETLRSDPNLPTNVRFAGYAETPAQALGQVNVLLSLSNFAESFGRTVAEAMAARRPVIAYEWGAIGELITHNITGKLVPYRDIESVANVVREICSTPSLIGEMGNAGYNKVTSNFSQARLTEQLCFAMTSIVQSKSMPRQPLVNDGKQRSSELKRVTVVVPVFNAYSELQQCLESLATYTDPNAADILILNDQSDDKRIKPLLKEFSNSKGFKVVHNEFNLGYTKTVNKGIALSGENDIILLNSDAVVTPNWLAGLRAVAYQEENAGTVTAMSDNAGAFSFPEMGKRNRLPDFWSMEELAMRVVQNATDCAPVEVPTGSGFCMFIRRQLLDQIGMFDEVAFPRGYGEENDFCMRAVRAGWRNFITPWSYVFHERSASFKNEKTELVRSGVDVVTKRYPEYADEVRRAFHGEDIASLRKKVASTFKGY